MLGFGATGQFAIGEVDTGTGGGGAEFIGPDKYMQRLGEPVLFRQGLQASSQQFLAFHPQPVVSFSWFEPLTEPVRNLPRSAAAMSPFHFWQPAPSPFVATGWFAPLSEPVRTKPGLRASQQSFLAYQSNPVTVTPFSWFAGLSEPVRFRRGLSPPAQQFFATDTIVIPTTKLMTWFAALSEPVRYRIGLRPPLQQAYAAPSRLLPTPTILGILSALETKDVFLGGIRAWNAAAAAEIGVIADRADDAEIGLIKAGPQEAGTTISSVRISIRMA